MLVLVLCTGLPGSGKSTFLHKLNELVHSAPFHVLRTLRLDDYVKCRRAFDPNDWRQASATLLKEVCADLRLGLMQRRSPDAHACQRDVLLFVEDNMPLTSMRERYWRVCGELGRAYGEWPALLELRFVAPVETCVERVQQRNEDVGEDASFVYVPEDVVRSMAATFESGAGKEGVNEVDDAACWVRVSTTSPWELVMQVKTADVPTTTLDFFRVMKDAALQHRLRDQEVRRRQSVVAGENTSAHTTGRVHQLDLLLRQRVAAFLSSNHQRPTNQPRMTQEVMHMKRSHLAQFRDDLQRSGAHQNGTTLEERCLASFDEALLHLHPSTS